MAFATYADVEMRLGRDLTIAEQNTASSVCDDVSGMIVEAAGIAEVALTATYFKALCVEKAISTITRPEPDIAAESLGAYSVTYSRSGDGYSVFLTEQEEYRVRRIANNAVSGSSRPHALPHDVYITEDA